MEVTFSGTVAESFLTIGVDLQPGRNTVTEEQGKALIAADPRVRAAKAAEKSKSTAAASGGKD